MKFKNLLIILFALGISFSTKAQTKIGYANLEAIISMLPETQTASKKLEAYQNQLSTKLEAKKNYFDVKYQEYVELSQESDVNEVKLATLQAELQKLQTELQQSVSDSDNKLSKKQNELMGPIMEKLENEIKAVADEKGYTYILNSSSSGSTIILHAAQSDDISKELLKRLGVEIPED